ncbi:MAG: hypothetical protein Q8K61_10660 [Gallionella sp.]|nr:hypothetical protein [Gallionella sp.]
MNDDKLNNLYYWVRTIGAAMSAFQWQPSEPHKAELLAILKEYQGAVSQGLPIGRGLPAPLEPADNLSDYYRRELNEALIQFKVRPEDGWEVLDRLATGYINAVQQGKIKP